MNIILLQKVQNLGQLGACVKVRPGYGRNYLIPQGKAVRATPKNLAEFEARRAEFEEKERHALKEARARAQAFEGTTLVLKARASEEGRLYGSVGLREVLELLSAQGVQLQKRELSLPEGGIRATGTYTLQAHLHGEVSVDFYLEVNAEG